jgi:thiol:disulfide interchange protein DsbA
MRASRIAAAAVLLLAVFGVASAQGLVSRYVAGEHYRAAEEPVAQPDDGKIHVVEFFLYSCPHCEDLEPDVEEWRESLADDVEFARVPVLFGAGGQAYARLYYAAEKLGVLEDVHGKIFSAIHDDGRRLLSEADMRAFMEDQGVDGERFVEAFESDEVSAKVRQAGETMRGYRVTATPSLGVAGQAYVSGRTAGSNDRMFDVADFLIRQQRHKNGG